MIVISEKDKFKIRGEKVKLENLIAVPQGGFIALHV